MPAMADEDIDRGLLSLADRGVIPPGAQLAIEPPPIQHKMAPLHSMQDRMSRERNPTTVAGTLTLCHRLKYHEALQNVLYFIHSNSILLGILFSELKQQRSTDHTGPLVPL